MEGNGAHFVGEVNDREKQSFLGKALALLFPSTGLSHLVL